MIRCIIIDDQSQSHELMADHIKKIPAFELAYTTTDPVEALNFLDKEKVDCIFLDVEMPGLTGLEFIETLRARPGNDVPKIILITGYDRYALTGFDYGVFDYLLKPISFKRFKIAADRLVAAFDRNPVERDFFFADVDGEKVKINFQDIICIEGAGNYISIITSEKKMTCYKTLSGIQQVLPRDTFIRVHKSFIVSLKHILSVRGNEIFLTVNKIQRNIPIGITYKESLLKMLRLSE